MLNHCYICHRAPSGFFWMDPSSFLSWEDQRKTCRWFCSFMCQNIHFHLKEKNKTMKRPDLEQKAAESVLKPLGDFVMQVGIHKTLENYNKQEILGLVNTILDAYHNQLQELYKDEVPF